MRFKQYLNEKTFSISADVDMIYKKYFLKYLKPFHKMKNNDLTDFQNKIWCASKKGKWDFGTTTSEIFKSRTAKKAHELNPVTLMFGAVSDGSFYSYKEKVISVSLNSDIIDLLVSGRSMDNIKNLMITDRDRFERFKNELSEESVKATIYHELSHWINDSMKVLFLMSLY